MLAAINVMILNDNFLYLIIFIPVIFYLFTFLSNHSTCIIKHITNFQIDKLFNNCSYLDWNLCYIAIVMFTISRIVVEEFNLQERPIIYVSLLIYI